jgi:hypothetical protein
MKIAFIAHASSLFLFSSGTKAKAVHLNIQRLSKFGL